MEKFIRYMAVFVAGFGACTVFLRLTGYAPPVSSVPIGRNAAYATTRTVSRSEPLPPVAEAASRVGPSVVSIEIEGLASDVGDERNRKRKLLPDDEMVGSGSGIIVSLDGYIVTNNHVIAPMAEQKRGKLFITLADGKEYTRVRIIGRDTESDLAVLKIDGVSGLPKAAWGDSDKLRVGDWALAVGNPLGFNSSVTLGIISALDRKDFRAEGDNLAHVLQTDAAINPGSSGGALADIQGRVIGINTAIASSSGGNVGIGFAIPINDARKVIDQIISTGKVVRPYMGIAFAGIDEIEPTELPRGMSLPEDGKGAIIIGNGANEAVAKDSPAHRAGLKSYDVIRAIEGKTVSEPSQVRDSIQSRKVGEKLSLRVYRDGKEFTASVTLEAMPEGYGSFRPRHFIENPDNPSAP